MTGVALWYWRYHHMYYDILDSEEEAARIAAAMTGDRGASIAGVQFPDGRLIRSYEWPAYAAAKDARQRAGEERTEDEPRPKRKITAPFDGSVIEIDADEPAWLGVTT